MGTPPIKDLVKMYVELRDRKATLEARHKGRVKQIDEWMALLEGLISVELSEEEARTGKPSISTANGTAYRETKTKYVLADKDVLFDAFEDTPPQTPRLFLHRLYPRLRSWRICSLCARSWRRTVSKTLKSPIFCRLVLMSVRITRSSSGQSK